MLDEIALGLTDFFFIKSRNPKLITILLQPITLSPPNMRTTRYLVAKRSIPY
jgi:hypothetical protein